MVNSEWVLCSYKSVNGGKGGVKREAATTCPSEGGRRTQMHTDKEYYFIYIYIVSTCINLC